MTTNTTDNGQRATDKSDWRLYAAAATAAMAAVSSADAAIVYVNPTDKPTFSFLGTNPANPFTVDRVHLNLNGFNPPASSAELVAVNAYSPSRPFFFAYPGIYGLPFMKNYKAGAAIGGGQLSASAVFRDRTSRNGIFGAFQTGKTGFAGFQLPASDGGGEGWMRVEVIDPDGTGGPSGVQVIDWAYNNAGGGITAGQGVTVPEPSALGLLAMGSAGVLAWRRRRNANAE